MQKQRTFTQKLNLFLKGLAMGAANKVPGVSGGTVSFVFGFSEELIYSFRKINIKAFKLLINGRFKSFFRYTNTQFLLLIMGGSIFSYFSISLVLDYFNNPPRLINSRKHLKSVESGIKCGIVVDIIEVYFYMEKLVIKNYLCSGLGMLVKKYTISTFTRMKD